ncbi:unnamed protein product [Choristocarpus tenellus]
MKATGRDAPWDGTELARRVLMREGEALVQRYMEVDGEMCLRQQSRGESSDSSSDGGIGHSDVEEGNKEGGDGDESISGETNNLPQGSKERKDSGGRTQPMLVLGALLQPPSTPLQRNGLPSTPLSVTSLGTTAGGTRGRIGTGVGTMMDLALTKREEVRHLVPAMLLLLKGLLLLPSERFAAEAPWVYPILVDLVGARDPTVRGLVRELLRTKVTFLLPFMM